MTNPVALALMAALSEEDELGGDGQGPQQRDTETALKLEQEDQPVAQDVSPAHEPVAVDPPAESVSSDVVTQMTKRRRAVPLRWGGDGLAQHPEQPLDAGA